MQSVYTHFMKTGDGSRVCLHSIFVYPDLLLLSSARDLRDTLNILLSAVLFLYYADCGCP